MPTALAARTKADRRPATAGTAAHARAPTLGLPLEGMTQLSISALSPADVLYLQRCAGNEAVCALMNRCPDDAPVQRKGPAAPPAAKPKAPPFPFAPGCDLKIPVEGSAPGLVTKAAKEVEDIEWIDGVKTGDPPLPEQIDLTFQASSEAQASKTEASKPQTEPTEGKSEAESPETAVAPIAIAAQRGEGIGIVGSVPGEW